LAAYGIDSVAKGAASFFIEPELWSHALPTSRPKYFILEGIRHLAEPFFIKTNESYTLHRPPTHASLIGYYLIRLIVDQISNSFHPYSGYSSGDSTED
jgi:hypothetical protein